MVPFLVVSLALGQVPGDLAKAAGCGDECSITGDTKAGTDANGQPLRVIHLSKGPVESESGAECEREEYWLAVGTKKRQLKQLLSLCNDGYGSAGVGEDEVKVKPNRVIHDQFGGTDSRLSVTREFQLEPPTLVSTTTTIFQSRAPQFVDEAKWSWDTFSGERSRFFSKCVDDGQPDLREELKPRPQKSTLIPKVAVLRDWVEKGWKESSLGKCGGRAPYVVQGSTGPETDASMKVIAISDTEFVFEIIDDVVTPGDTLQVWLGDQATTPWDSCIGKNALVAPSEWLVQVTTGLGRTGTNARFGAPTSEVVQQGGAVRIKMKLPEGVWYGMTFAYADSDDGKTVKRTLATSALQSSQLASLGLLFPIERRVAICEVENGALTPRRPPLPKKGPLFPGNVMTGAK
ncbi:MAG: hypothetical protein JNM17_14555 [Archangium sp.]|nr:hypothetical protein [Archangium sp.]